MAFYLKDITAFGVRGTRIPSMQKLGHYPGIARAIRRESAKKWKPRVGRNRTRDGSVKSVPSVVVPPSPASLSATPFDTKYAEVEGFAILSADVKDFGNREAAVPVFVVSVIATQIQHKRMSETDTPPDKTTVNIRMTETFLADVDGTWQELGYNSRSEFIRDVLRDAVKHPDFDRADLKAMLAGEIDIQNGRTHSSDDVKEKYDLGDGATNDE